jgi:hypothetical protein
MRARQLLGTAAVMIAAVCLQFTVVPRAHADESTRSRWGTSLRLGSVVGHTELAGERLTTLGLQIALGYKLGPVAIEAEYDSGTLLQKIPDGNHERGELDRLGVNARLYVARIGRSFEPDSLLLLFLEGGLGRQHAVLVSRDEFWRSDTSVGAGWLLDHRAAAPHRPFKYIGWHFGWRLTATPKASQTASARLACKSTDGGCPDMEFGPGRDLGLVVSSSITFSW